MIKKKGMPITGTNTAMKPSPGVLANQADTSADLQKRLKKSPQPFTASGGAATLPTKSGASGGISTMEPKIAAGLKHSNPGAKALPSGGAVGYKKLPNQSGQIGGHMGYPPPKRKAGSFPSGYKAKKGAAFYGEA